VSKETKSGNKEAIKQKEILERLLAVLENEQPARTLETTEDEREYIRTLTLLTTKPILYVLNTDDPQAETKFKWNGELIKLNVKLEEEIAALPEDEQAEYIKELGLNESGLDKLIRAAYQTLGLDTFFTTGSDESRAWTIVSGTKAPQAAAVIHTDFEKGFVRAEVINWQKFVEAGSEIKARELGLIRTEGKDYTMVDGDVCNFLINR